MNLFITQPYTNLEQFCRDSFRWDVSFRQLSKGGFNGSITLIDIGDIQIGKIKLNGTLIQEGICPRGFRTFVIPADNTQSFNWLKKDVNHKDLLLFEKQGQLEAISFENFHCYMISIKEDLLHNLIQKYELLNLEKNISTAENVFRLNGGYFSHIQNYLNSMIRSLVEKPSLINSESFQYKIRDRFCFLFLSFLDVKNFSRVKPQTRKRDIALNLCCNYIDNNRLHDISLTKLVEITNMSERTLQLAFIERYGLTPIEFINHTKLNEVRVNLLNTPTHKISDIAQKVGFKHMGQFSAAYNKLFNELPRDTVRKMKIDSFY